MKKITLLLFILLSVSSFSQTSIFSEDFESSDVSSWTFYDVNNVADDDWFLTDETNWTEPLGIYEGNFLVSFSWNDVDFSPDNIAVTPLISIPSTATDAVLEFFSGSGSDPDFFSEHYAVYITTENSQAAILASTPVFEETLSVVGGSVKSVDIGDYAGMDVYISFRHFNTTGEWLLGIDNISISSVLLNTDEFESSKFKYFYNKDNNVLTITSSSLAFETIEMYNLLGQQVLNRNLSQTIETVNMSSLEDGVYLAKVTIQGRTQTVKILKN